MGDLINEICTAVMLLAFGASWPFNIIKLWKARSTKNVSLPFYILIWSGYVVGMIGRCFKIADSVPADLGWAFWLAFCVYIIDIIMLTVALTVYFRNRMIEKKEQ